MVLKRQMAILCTRNRISYTKNLRQQRRVKLTLFRCCSRRLLRQQPGAVAAEDSKAVVRSTYRMNGSMELSDSRCGFAWNLGVMQGHPHGCHNLSHKGDGKWSGNMFVKTHTQANSEMTTCSAVLKPVHGVSARKNTTHAKHSTVSWAD